MRLIIKNKEGVGLRIPVPAGILLTRTAGDLVSKHLKQSGTGLTKQQATALLKELKRFTRRHPGWVLVEVKSADGGYIKITL